MGGRVTSTGLQLVRAVVIWAVEAISLFLLARIIPGVTLGDWRAAVAAALVLGLLNALLRPLVLLLAVNLGIVPFTLIAFALNAAAALLTAQWVPGFDVAGPGSALALAFGLALLNGVLTGLLSLNDEDSLSRNVTRFLARRRTAAPVAGQPGTVIVQIDGLAEPVLRQELASGKLPTVARWLAGGSHRLAGWECAVPSMTSAVQAGLFYGDASGIPAFRWFDKAAGRMFVSNHPADVRALDARLSAAARGLLAAAGETISSLLTGGAPRSAMTMASLVTDTGERRIDARDFYTYLANPYNLLRGLLGSVGEVCVEYWEAWRQRRKRVEPRMHRGGVFPLLRAATTVVLRDAAVWLTVDALYHARRVIYMNYLGYDEVAHHAGHEAEDARRVLRGFDRHLATIEAATRRAPRPYHLVVLSDHGQCTGWTFKQRYGYSLGDLVQRLIAGGAEKEKGAAPAAGGAPAVYETGGDEGWGHLNALLTEAVRTEGVTGRGARLLLHGPPEGTAGDDTGEGAAVALGPEERERRRAGEAGVVVCPSGNLANVYFTREPGRLSLEYLAATYPGLVEGLVAHPGIAFVLVSSEARGHLVLGRRGVRDLDSGRAAGEDPLAVFSPNLAAQLRRISGYDNVGDLLVNSFYNPKTGEVAAFEELIGCHGGAGGPQQQPFLIYPAAWTKTAEPGAGEGEVPRLVGAEQVHAFLARHAGLGESDAPAAGRSSSPARSPG